MAEFDPWVGCRVGEATNPGPGGSQASARKRAKNQQGQSQEAGLAAQLMGVLENFQAGPKHKRAKIKSDNDSSGNQLANTLLAILNNAVQRNWSDTKVAASMIEHLEPFVYHNDQSQDEWEESGGYAQGNQFHEDAMQFETWQKGSYNGHNSWYYDRASWWDKTGQQTSFSDESTTVTAAANAVSAKTSWTGLRFGAKVSAQEWSVPTQLGTVNQIRKALEQGQTVTQNLVITKDPSVVDEIQQLWNAFEQTQPLTVATVVSNDQTGPTVSVWWDLSKQFTHKPARVKLKLWQASSMNGPIPQKPQILNDFEVSDRPKQVTVRILAPEFYRKLLPGIDHADTPNGVSSLAVG